MKEQYSWNVPDSVIRFAESVIEELGSDPYTPPLDRVDRIADALYERQKRCAPPGDLRDHIIVALFEKRKRELYRMLMRIRNGSPSAVRVCEMFDRGEIDGERMLGLLGGPHDTMFA